ncbi:MAG TPA: hypothetical protein VFL17_19425 [Anaerolineae bacterium]|nr:hypothetical protein [Anaerolineae bacterium]
MKLTFLVLCLALTVTACTQEQAPLQASPTSAPPAEPPTSEPPTVALPTAAPPTAAPPTVAPTVTAEPPTAAAPTEAPTDTPTAGPSPTARPRATATAAGPLDFQTYVAGCRLAPTPEKPGNVVITISVEATGGNGVYRYFHRDVEEPDKFIDIEWEKGTRLIGEVTVTSAGQSLTKEYDFQPTDYCP